MSHQTFIDKLNSYRYEFLLTALLVLIFDKIFFPDNAFYLKYVWLFNMLLIAVASFGIFLNRSLHLRRFRNIMSLTAVLMPVGFVFLNTQNWFIQFLTLFFIVYYSSLFVEVMIQIISIKEVRLNVVIGSFCGYLLLSMIALFAYVLIEFNYPNSFHGLTQGNVALAYNELSYFSFITLTSIGFGDIYPITDMSRLTTAFFGMLGQFYMVAVVGIIISKFTSK